MTITTIPFPIFSEQYEDLNECIEKRRKERYMILDVDKFREDILISHNDYRSHYAAPALEESTQLNKIAQATAEYLKNRGELMLSRKKFNGDLLGENLHRGNSKVGWREIANRLQYRGVRDWFEEPASKMGDDSSDAQLEAAAGSSGHFSQIVWQGSTQLGVGAAVHHDGTVYLVCNYYPAGNIVGQFVENILPKLSTSMHMLPIVINIGGDEDSEEDKTMALVEEEEDVGGFSEVGAPLIIDLNLPTFKAKQPECFACYLHLNGDKTCSDALHEDDDMTAPLDAGVLTDARAFDETPATVSPAATNGNTPGESCQKWQELSGQKTPGTILGSAVVTPEIGSNLTSAELASGKTQRTVESIGFGQVTPMTTGLAANPESAPASAVREASARTAKTTGERITTSAQKVGASAQKDGGSAEKKDGSAQKGDAAEYT